METQREVLQDWSEIDGFLRQRNAAEALVLYLDNRTSREVMIEENQLALFVRRMIYNGLDKIDPKTEIASEVRDSQAEKPAAPVSIMTCPQCKRIFEDPVTLLCENDLAHTFCRNCLSGVSGPSQCPACGTLFSGIFLDKTNISFAIQGLLDYMFPHQMKMYRAKKEGNQLFQSKNYQGAIEKYSDALLAGGPEATLLSNRSHAEYLLQQYEAAVADAMEAIQLRPLWSKGYYRKAIASAALDDLPGAISAGLQLLMLDSDNVQMRELLPKWLWKSLCLHQIHQLPVRNLDMKTAVTISSERLQEWAETFQNIFRLSSNELQNQKERTMPLRNSSLPEVPITSKDILEELLTCMLCYRLLLEPVTTDCGHTFCKPCLQRVLDFGPSCPECRKDLSDLLANRRFPVSEVLQKVTQELLPSQHEDRVISYREELENLKLVKERETEIPIFILTVAWPGLPLDLHVFEPRYRLMVRQAVDSGSMIFGMAAERNEAEEPFVNFGTMLRIGEGIEYEEDGRLYVTTRGERRFKVLQRGMRDGYSTARVEYIQDEPIAPERLPDAVALQDEVYGMLEQWLERLTHTQLERITELTGPLPPKADLSVYTVDGPQWMWWFGPMLSDLVLEPVSFLQDTFVVSRLRTIREILVILNSRIRPAPSYIS